MCWMPKWLFWKSFNLDTFSFTFLFEVFKIFNWKTKLKHSKEWCQFWPESIKCFANNIWFKSIRIDFLKDCAWDSITVDTPLVHRTWLLLMHPLYMGLNYCWCTPCAWGLITVDTPLILCPEYDTKLYLVVRFQFLSSKNYELTPLLLLFPILTWSGSTCLGPI